MKVVLFCGGLGTRIREYGENTPKPMIPVGEALKDHLRDIAMALRLGQTSALPQPSLAVDDLCPTACRIADPEGSHVSAIRGVHTNPRRLAVRFAKA